MGNSQSEFDRSKEISCPYCGHEMRPYVAAQNYPPGSHRSMICETYKNPQIMHWLKKPCSLVDGRISRQALHCYCAGCSYAWPHPITHEDVYLCNSCVTRLQKAKRYEAYSKDTTKEKLSVKGNKLITLIDRKKEKAEQEERERLEKEKKAKDEERRLKEERDTAIREKERKEREAKQRLKEAEDRKKAEQEAKAKERKERERREQEAEKKRQEAAAKERAMAGRRSNPYHASNGSQVNRFARQHAQSSISHVGVVPRPGNKDNISDDRKARSPGGIMTLQPQKFFGEWAEPVTSFLNGHVFVYRYLHKSTKFSESFYVEGRSVTIGNYEHKWIVFNHFSVPITINFDPSYWSEPMNGSRMILTDYLTLSVPSSPTNYTITSHIWTGIGFNQDLDSVMFGMISGLEGYRDQEVGWRDSGYWEGYCHLPDNIDEYHRLKNPPRPPIRHLDLSWL